MSLLGDLGGALKGAVTGFVTGGPAGAVAGAGIGFASAAFGAAPRPPAPPPLVGMGGGLNIGPYQFGGNVTYGKQTTYTAGGQITGSGATGPGCPRGYHLNKHALPASRSHQAVPPRSICVRNRHINALNGRAAGRALRRLKRADKMTRKIHHLFHHTARKPAARKR